MVFLAIALTASPAMAVAPDHIGQFNFAIFDPPGRTIVGNIKISQEPIGVDEVGIHRTFVDGDEPVEILKEELVNAIAKDAKLTKKDAKTMEAPSDRTDLTKADSKKVVVKGWNYHDKKAATRREPQTGKEIQIPEKDVVKFKAGSDLSKTAKSILSDGKKTDVNVEELELVVEKIERALALGED